jgi:hypothetical protein
MLYAAPQGGGEKAFARAMGFDLASRRAVALLGLVTASRAVLLNGTGSGVQIPVELTQVSSFALITHNTSQGGAVRHLRGRWDLNPRPFP